MVQTLVVGEASGLSQQEKQQILVSCTLNISNHMEVGAQKSPNVDECVDAALNVQEAKNLNRSIDINAVVHAAVTNEQTSVTKDAENNSSVAVIVTDCDAVSNVYTANDSRSSSKPMDGQKDNNNIVVPRVDSKMFTLKALSLFTTPKKVLPVHPDVYFESLTDSDLVVHPYILRSDLLAKLHAFMSLLHHTDSMMLT
ncbi:hypothetical protein ACH5RR_006738 [Cinchona calisaya]|uniref:Uncharacterized protein n=1 Tax=Cinchona calisaya TaxID=153742 RepID=A0ABD3AQ68_9GENT